jgi:hypothetical protein
MTVQERLAPLREETPTGAQVAAVFAAARTPRRRRRRRAGFALVAATAIAAAVVAALPAARQPTDAVSLLRAAAAAAADAPPAFTGYRYTEVIEHWRWEGTRPEEVEQRVENWVDRDWKGRRIAHQGKVFSGREDNYFAQPHDDPFVYGDGPLANVEIEKLPTDPKALLAALDANERGQNWAPGLPTPDQARYDITYSVLLLLGTANTTPELRSALWGVLALMPGLRSEPGVRDPIGREGDAVTLTLEPAENARPGTFRVIFDAKTSSLLSWSLSGQGGGTPAQTHTFVRAGQVRNAGDRPD